MSAGQVLTSPVIQTTRTTRTTLGPKQKYAVYAATGELSSESVRLLVLEALAARGWNEERINAEYLRYVTECTQNGEENLFPGGRL
jgi:hypothetical protein